MALGLALFGTTASAAPLLGQTVNLSAGAAAAMRATGVCNLLSCQGAVIATIDPQTTYLGVLDGGAFMYLVGGRIAMVGWMGRPHGESPLTPTPAKFHRLSQVVAGQGIPQSWLSATWENWDQSLGLDPGKVKRSVQGNAVYGGKWGNGAWYTLYISQAPQEPRLRALINRVEPKNAQAIATRFRNAMGGPLSPMKDRCKKGTMPLMANVLVDNGAYNRFNAYFKRLNMPAIGCCGGPASWSLPGLSASSVWVETRDYESDVEPPNACVGGA